MNTTVTVALAIGAVVVLVAAVALRVADRLGLPSLLLYLALGLALGESGLGVEFEDAELTQNLGVAALVIILAEGGLTTRWSDVRRAIGPGISLATIGVGGQRRGDRRDHRLAAGRVMGVRPAAGRRHQLDGRGGRVRRPASPAAPAPAGRLHRGRERAQRRPGDPPRHGGRGRHRRPGVRPVVAHRRRRGARAGRRRRDRWPHRLRGCRTAAPGRAAGGRLLPAGHARAQRPRLLGGVPRAHLGVRRRLPVRGRAGQRRAAAPVGQHRLRRGHGVPRPDRAVRAARPARPRRPGCWTRSARRWSSAARCCSSPGRCRWL